MQGKSAFFKTVLASFLAALCVFPLIYLAVLSLARDWTFPHLVPPKFQSGVWDLITGRTKDIGGCLLTSILIATSVATLSTLAGFVTSRILAWHPWRNRLVLFAHLPFGLSPVIFAICLFFLFIKLHLSGHLGGVIVGQFIYCYGYSVILFLGFWNANMKALEELVYTLGGSGWQMFWRVLLPVAREMVLVGFFQTFLMSWFDYALALVLGSAACRP